MTLWSNNIVSRFNNLLVFQTPVGYNMYITLHLSTSCSSIKYKKEAFDTIIAIFLLGPKDGYFSLMSLLANNIG